MSLAFLKNIGAFIKVLRAFANTSVTAAGSGDNTAITGAILDRQANGNAQSAVVAIPYLITLASAETFTLKNVLVEHGDASNLSDVATFATLEDSTGSVIATGVKTAVSDCKSYSVNLAGAKRYIRVKATPDLSASGTDTAAISGVVVFGGQDSLPTS
jgi:hypothetical protein